MQNVVVGLNETFNRGKLTSQCLWNRCKYDTNPIPRNVFGVNAFKYHTDFGLKHYV